MFRFGPIISYESIHGIYIQSQAQIIDFIANFSYGGMLTLVLLMAWASYVVEDEYYWCFYFRSVQDHSQSSMQDNQRKKSTLSIHNSQNLGSMRSIDEPSNHKIAVSTEEAHLTKGPEQIVYGSVIDIKSSTSIGKQHGLTSANVVSESVLLNGAISEV